jgi:ribosomal protein S4
MDDERIVVSSHLDLVRIMAVLGLSISLSQARCLISQGAVVLDGVLVVDPMAAVPPGDHEILVEKRQRVLFHAEE